MNPLTKKFVVNRINCPMVVAQAIKEDRYVYVGRPSKWGNPFVVGRDGTRTEVIAMYRAYLLESTALIEALPELKGKLLGCSCLPMPCHAEVLAELANSENTFVEQVSGICKCSKKFTVGHQDTVPMVLHEMPPCPEYVRLDLVDYLRWVRGATEN